jgi:5-methylthioribose kinase
LRRASGLISASPGVEPPLGMAGVHLGIQSLERDRAALLIRFRVLVPNHDNEKSFGFDIGAIIANLFSAAIYHHIVTKDNDYQEWIYKTVIEIYEKFEEKFLALWDKEKNSALITEGFIDEKNLSLFKKEFMQNIFKESIGFAGCKMARRVFGIAGVKEIRGIEDKTLRQKAERKALDIGVMMVKSHKKINSPKEFTEAVRERL